MAEEKAEKNEQKKKTPGVAKLVFKWFGVGVVCVLLLGAVVFAAPWKVVALLAIIFATCTVLPKPARKWFWAGVGVVIIALIIWVFLPESNGDWRPYTFDEELAALEAKRAIPDEENTARIYNELLKIPLLDGNEPEFFARSRPSSKSGPWLSKDHPEMAEWLEEKEYIIQRLIEASKIKECRFPIEADMVTFTNTMERLAPMRQWAYLLIAAGNNDLGEARVNQALEKHNAVLRMAGHVYQQVTVVEMLVGFALEALALRQFNRFLVTGDAGEDELAKIELALGQAGYDWSGDFRRVMECEKLLHKSLLGMFYVINPEGKTRLNPSVAMRAMIARLPEDMKEQIGGETGLAYWRRRLMKAHAALAWFYMPSSPRKAGEIIDGVYERYYLMAEPDYDWRKGMKKPGKIFRLNYRYMIEHMIEILGPAYDRIHDVYLRLMGDKRGSQIIVALRRYKNANGCWPESLDEVRDLAPEEIFVDAINNGSFVYKLTDDGFALYSKGKNGVDDGAERDEKTGADDWLIWPPKSRKTQEGNGDD